MLTPLRILMFIKDHEYGSCGSLSLSAYMYFLCDLDMFNQIMVVNDYLVTEEDTRLGVLKVSGIVMYEKKMRDIHLYFFVSLEMCENDVV